MNDLVTVDFDATWTAAEFTDDDPVGREIPGAIPRTFAAGIAFGGERRLVISPPAGCVMPVLAGIGPGGQAAAGAGPSSSGRACLATATSAENDCGSETASSASIRRSTSTQAIFRPWMNRL